MTPRAHGIGREVLWDGKAQLAEHFGHEPNAIHSDVLMPAVGVKRRLERIGQFETFCLVCERQPIDFNGFAGHQNTRKLDKKIDCRFFLPHH